MSNSTHTLLIAEDDPMNLELLRRRLDGRGYDIIFTTNGREAIDKIKKGQHEFSAIILDRTMPEMDGMQVLAFIKQDPRLRDTPVILQTALADSQSITEGIAAGAFYYLTKPYNKEVLVTVVDSAVNDYTRTKKLQQALDARQRGLRLLRQGQFGFRTLEEANELATTLASMCPKPDAAVSGISELLTNAVEHGNLEITYEDKSELLKAGRWTDEIERRLADPKYRDRVVEVSWQRSGDGICIRIKDQGNGFKPDAYLKFDPARATHSHGRGIAMAIMRSFDMVEYQGKGNEVVASISGT